jgi:glycosyltransferase involved in cell wall biosynthesis
MLAARAGLVPRILVTAATTMRVLFVHPYFPAHYLQIARHLATAGGNEVIAIAQTHQPGFPGVRRIVYRPAQDVAGISQHTWSAHSCVSNALAVADIATDLRRTGFEPDIVLGHSAWGEIWHLRDVFPQTPLLGYFEFFHRAHGADVGFDAEAPPVEHLARQIRWNNLGNLLGLDVATAGQCPSYWQRSGYPTQYHGNLKVFHDGVDTRTVSPDPLARLRIAGREVRAGDEVVTYVARSLEPHRGFHIFMRSLPTILAARPNAQVLIVGGDEPSYTPRPSDGRTYRQRSLDELGDSLDLSRVHFLNTIPYAQYVKALQVSRVHVHLSYPHTLASSLLEAMSAGCLVVGSNTAAIQEAINDRENGLLVDFFSPRELADRVIEALESPHAHDSIRRAARESVIRRFDAASVCVPAHMRLIETLRASNRSSAARTT